MNKAYGAPQAWRIKLVVQRLNEGAVIAYPTEGVWGLGCVPENYLGVQRILAMKQRTMDQGLILVAGDVSQVESYLDGITAAQRDLLDSVWPGAVTFLVPHNGTAPDWIRGKHNSVAIRVSAHPVIKAICERLEQPIVSTSANPSGKPAAMSALRLRKYFPQGIDYFFPGQLLGKGATEIRELSTGAVLRAATP